MPASMNTPSSSVVLRLQFSPVQAADVQALAVQVCILPAGVSAPRGLDLPTTHTAEQ